MLIFSREKYGFVNVAVLYKIFLAFHFWIHILYLLTVYINRVYHQPICRQLEAMVHESKQNRKELFQILANSFQLDCAGAERNSVA